MKPRSSVCSKKANFAILNHISRLCGCDRSHFDWHLPACQLFLTTVATMGAGDQCSSAARRVWAAWLRFRPANRDQGSENSSVWPVTQQVSYGMPRFPYSFCTEQTKQLHARSLVGLLLLAGGTRQLPPLLEVWSLCLGVHSACYTVQRFQFFQFLC